MLRSSCAANNACNRAETLDTEVGCAEFVHECEIAEAIFQADEGPMQSAIDSKATSWQNTHKTSADV